MTIEKMERVMWRIRARNKGKTEIFISELRRAVMYEIGTDVRTYNKTKTALKRLGWIKKKGPQRVILTGNDLTGDDV